MSALTTYYRQAIDLSDVSALEEQLKNLLNTPIESVADLETWIAAEIEFSDCVNEVMTGHAADFYRDTNSAEKRDIHVHDQSKIQPLLRKYQAEFDHKFCASPYVGELNEVKYGLMRKERKTSLELFHEDNLPLLAREQEIITQYNTLVGGLTVKWEGEEKPLPLVNAQLDNPNRDVRERAFRGVQAAYRSIKSDVDAMMDELVKLRHQIAVNAGFQNYQEYAFREKNREYSLEDCRRFHDAVEKYIVPVWDFVANDLRNQLGADTYRPWDNSNCTISAPPFSEVDELIAGVESIFRQIDEEFGDIFVKMRDNGLLDLEGRQGKAPGGFCMPLPMSRTSFVFSNFSPSYFALIVLIHEMGHAINAEYQFRKKREWMSWRSEIAELYSHSMELMSLDKLSVFYRDPAQNRAAIGERIRRSLKMVMGPLSGDKFQHWMYTNPNHTPAERDAAYLEISKRYTEHPVDWSGFEEELGMGWISSIHFIGYPFYNIEYSMAELGALQLLQQYRENPTATIANYKRGASADYNQSISQVYDETGVSFDFSNEAIEKTAHFLKEFWTSLSNRT